MTESSGSGRSDRRVQTTRTGGPKGGPSTKRDPVHAEVWEIEREIAELQGEREMAERELAELQAERDRVWKLLDDPIQLENRRVRCERQLGVWVAARVNLEAGDLAELRALFPAEWWLWEEALLANDGWVRGAPGWRLPASGNGGRSGGATGGRSHPLMVAPGTAENGRGTVGQSTKELDEFSARVRARIAAIDRGIEKQKRKRRKVISEEKERLRKRDTRRKIVVGGALIALVRSENPAALEAFKKVCSEVEPRDAELFDEWEP